MNKMLAFTLVIAFVLLLGCAGGGRKSCKTDDDCELWGTCNTSSSTCYPKPGYCASDADCRENRVCGEDHRCAMEAGLCETNEDCDEWQVCDTVMGTCMPKVGYCSDETFCGNEWETCNTTFHKCVPAEGRCVDSFDCKPHQICHVASKECRPLQGRCDADIDCKRWQYCDLLSNNCMLKPGLCESDENCMGYQYCHPETKRCLTRKLAEAEKIIARVQGQDHKYTLKTTVERETAGHPSTINGGVAEIPLERGMATELVFDCTATEGASGSGIAEAFLFGLLRNDAMLSSAKGDGLEMDPGSLPVTPEPSGIARLDSYGGLALASANWHAPNADWKPGTRLNLTKYGVSPGEKFRVIAEFDHESAYGELTLYIKNMYGTKTKLSAVNYTTYVNGEGKDSVAAVIGGVWQGAMSATPSISIKLEPSYKTTVQQNYTYEPGYCSTDSDCNPWELCNPITHKCYLKLGWCVYDGDCPKGYECRLDPRTADRRICVPIVCGKDEDCPGSTCNIAMHLCRPVPPYCGPDNYTCYNAPRTCTEGNKCAPWENCEVTTGQCVTKMGMCDSDHDCAIGTVCELDTNKQSAHTCVAMLCSTSADCPGTTCDTNKGTCRPLTP